MPHSARDEQGNLIGPPPPPPSAPVDSGNKQPADDVTSSKAE
jgi:hypothetical protein